MNSLEIMEPSACTWCGIARRGHGRQYADAVGYHSWEQPTDEQIKARMQARRLALAVAREGALPVPVGPEPEVDPVAAGRRLDLLALMDERAASVVSPVLAAVLDEAERLRVRVAKLEAQREALAERMRAGQQWRRGRDPELVSENFVSQSELRAIFGIPLAAPWAGEPAEADGITRRNVPLQALRADADRGLLAEQSHQLDPADSVFAAMACACPEACSCDADYPGWAAGLAAAEGAGR